MENKGPYDLDIKARAELVKRLQHPRSLLEAAAAKERAKRVAVFEKTKGEYKTPDEAHDAYGYDCITEAEYEQIKEAFEKGEKFVEENTSPEEAAFSILTDFIGRLEREIRSFKFEQLSPEEQARIIESNNKFFEKIRKRRNEQ